MASIITHRSPYGQMFLNQSLHCVMWWLTQTCFWQSSQYGCLHLLFTSPLSIFALLNFSVDTLYFQNPEVRIIQIRLHETLFTLYCWIHQVLVFFESYLSFSAWNNSRAVLRDSMIAIASPLHGMIKHARLHHLELSALFLHCQIFSVGPILLDSLSISTFLNPFVAAKTSAPFVVYIPLKGITFLPQSLLLQVLLWSL